MLDGSETMKLIGDSDAIRKLRRTFERGDGGEGGGPFDEKKNSGETGNRQL